MPRRALLTAGELSERTEVDSKTLEAWVDRGLLQPEGKGSTGAPFFTDEMVERVTHIKNLLEMGYGEEEVGKILRKVGPPVGGVDSKRERGAAESLLTVGALAESVGVSPRTIKHWEEKGIIEADTRSEGGFRLYKEHYAYLCHLIQDLQLFGYSLDEIKKISDYFRDFVVIRDDVTRYPPEEAETRLSEMVSEIDTLFATTKKLRDGIERWEKLLNKHRRLIADIKRSNEKRLEEKQK
jgi:DNA-binding transcriptional MerR regulator